DRERVVLTMAGEPVDLELVRVKGPAAGLVWLVSSRTLEQVPTLHRSAGVTWLEGVMPAWLLDLSFLGVSFAQWTAWAASLLIPLGTLWLLSALFIRAARRTVAGEARRALLNWYAGLRWPVIV